MDMKLVKKIFSDYRIPLLTIAIFAVMSVLKENFLTKAKILVFLHHF